MRMLQCLLLSAALGGIAGSGPAGAAPSVLVRETLEDLKAEIAAASKEGDLDEEQAVAFAKRAAAVADQAKDAATRVGALETSLTLRFRNKSEELAKVREGIWDLVIDKDANEGALLAPLVARSLKDEARLAKLRQQTKAPELAATFALMDLQPLLSKRDRTEKETKDLVAAIEALKKEHGKTADPLRKQTWAETCDNLLFPIQRLAIGQEVPDIEGKDTSGVAFKLSDYRGKVVLIDFWGHW